MTEKKSYDDIIGVEYPVKTARPRMSMNERAAQFSPFAALTGYDDVISSVTEEMIKSFED